MKESTEKLKAFLQENYIDNESMGSPDMPTAIRDVLTDLLHLCDEEDMFIDHTLPWAREVYEEEISLEVSHKTGVQD
jgi:hypothetical protein